MDFAKELESIFIFLSTNNLVIRLQKSSDHKRDVEILTKSTQYLLFYCSDLVTDEENGANLWFSQNPLVRKL